MTAAPAVFLDRDGVLNCTVIRDGRPYPPRSLQELTLIPDAKQSCHDLREAGFLLIMVTNQPDIARGAASAESVAEINERLRIDLGLHEVCVCPHDDADRCACRKPAPGMLLESTRRWGLDLSSSFMVGDRWRDIAAGRSAGCRTVFIDYGYLERRPDSPDAQVKSLGEAARWILAMRREELSSHA